MKKILIITTFTILAAMSLPSCRDTDGPEEVNPRVYDIVCLRSLDNSGSTFTLTKPNSGNVITYTSTARIDTTVVPVGDRLMLAYNMPQGILPYTSGSITAYGYSPVVNDVLRAGVIDSIPDWSRDPIDLTSAWMSEDFLNIRAAITYDERPRQYFVMLDTLTTDRLRPACYLVHKLQEPAENFERDTYLSVDMSAMHRKLSGCQGFELRYNDIDNHYNTIIFDFN